MGRRTRYSEWWSPTIRSAMKRYPQELEAENTGQADRLLTAIRAAIEEANNDPSGRGAEAVKIASMFYFRKTHSFRDACAEAGVSFGTGKRRIAKLVYMIGDKAGYTPQ